MSKVPSTPLHVERPGILTETRRGFLASGYTHTLNPYVGCGFANAACGEFCYARQMPWITRGRPWGLYEVKANAAQAYRRDYDRIKSPKRPRPRMLRIYMSSVTDPYPPHERKLGITRSLLEGMVARPPDVLVIQSHGTLVERDLDVIGRLARECELWLSLTVETDMDPVPGLRPHASRPADRIAILRRFREQGIPTEAAISPLLPIQDIATFVGDLDAACDRVVIDHYLVGDGSGGARTARSGLPRTLDDHGFGRWNSLDTFREIEAIFAERLGRERVLVSCEGFNSVGARPVNLTIGGADLARP